MEIFISDNGKMIKLMDLVAIIQLMGVNIKGNGNLT
jgi:hypothetical protein